MLCEEPTSRLQSAADFLMSKVPPSELKAAEASCLAAHTEAAAANVSSGDSGSHIPPTESLSQVNGAACASLTSKLAQSANLAFTVQQLRMWGDIASRSLQAPTNWPD